MIGMEAKCLRQDVFENFSKTKGTVLLCRALGAKGWVGGGIHLNNNIAIKYPKIFLQG